MSIHQCSSKYRSINNEEDVSGGSPVCGKPMKPGELSHLEDNEFTYQTSRDEQASNTKQLELQTTFAKTSHNNCGKCFTGSVSPNSQSVISGEKYGSSTQSSSKNSLKHPVSRAASQSAPVIIEENVERNIHMKTLMEKESDDLLMILHSQHKDFSDSLTCIGENIESLAPALKLINKACKSSHRSLVASFLGNIFQNKNFVFYSLTRSFLQISKNSAQSVHKEALEDVIDTLIAFHQTQPTLAIEVISVLMPLLEKACETGFQDDLDTLKHLLEKLAIIEEEKNCFVAQFTKEDLSKLSNAERKNALQPPNDFRTIDILPNMHDLNDTSPFLRPNIIHGRYQDIDHYLDVQFRLLREDFMRPLRQGIAAYKLSKTLKKKMELEDIRVHQNVSITKHCLNKNDENVIEVTFTKGHFKKIDWEHNRRFINGTLLCLSHDGFKSLLLASVEEKDTKLLVEGKLILKPEVFPDDILYNEKIRFFEVIETDALFAAYRYSLGILQQISGSDFPMAKYIVHVQKKVDKPCYLTHDTVFSFAPLYNPVMLCGCGVYNKCHKCNKKKVKVLDLNDWPSEKDLRMNKSQYEALKNAITKEFLIIQGPPGTGKTFIGLKIVKLILHNSIHLHLGPILILCYSNHALDQFLEGISEFNRKIVRVGGGCKNKNLKPFLLRNKRKYEHLLQSLTKESIALRRIESEINDTKRCMNDCFYRILEDRCLWEYMNNEHRESFYVENAEGNVILQWLGEKSPKANWLSNDKETGGGIMSQSEVDSIYNIWRLHPLHRRRLYTYWMNRHVEYLRSQLSRLKSRMQKENEKFQNKRDLVIMSKSKVIGMTITGAAKYQHFLQVICPGVIVIEEAAEILESHIVTSLSSKTQHLILIGDHQQLKPKPNVYELSVRYNMDVSLFERMVINQINYSQLTIQHRMRPAISSLLVPRIYRNLVDHESVTSFDNILGVGKDVYFISHNHLEDQAKDSESKINIHEAEFLVQFCLYLLQQGYDPSQITILTTYLGQKYVIEKLPKNKQCISVNVSVVDNYQGKENDIILLSFVRSNSERKIGYLATPNRVCVALSRARKGLYCVGNFDLFAEKSSLWRGLVESLNENDCISTSLPLYCQNHPETVTKVYEASDFDSVPEGGCSLPCDFHLACGHYCIRKCHPDDKSHKVYKCHKDCSKLLCKRNHNCPLKCYEKCEPCSVLLDKWMPNCGHVCQFRCSVYDFARCYHKVTAKFPCGHEGHIECHQLLWMDPFFTCGSVVKCQYEITTKLLCGHEKSMLCHQLTEVESFSRKDITFKYKQEISTKFPCGHESQIQCFSSEKRISLASYNLIRNCMHEIKANFPCGHMNQIYCYQSSWQDPFSTCGSVQRCQHEVTRKLPCGHDKPMLCHQLTQLDRLDEHLAVVSKQDIKASFPCGHANQIQCCPIERLDYKSLQICTHAVKAIFPCGHENQIYCHQASWKDPFFVCGSVAKCPHKITVSLRCGHKKQIQCHELWQIDEVSVRYSDESDKVNFPCGHESQIQCLQSSVTHSAADCSSIRKCHQETTVKFPCRHENQMLCHQMSQFDLLTETCSKPCKVQLECGHLCEEQCQNCFQGRLHQSCRKPCNRTLICGDVCQNQCNKPCGPCAKDQCKYDINPKNDEESSLFLTRQHPLHWESTNCHSIFEIRSTALLSNCATKVFKTIFEIHCRYEELNNEHYQVDKINHIKVVSLTRQRQEKKFFIVEEYEPSRPCKLFQLVKKNEFENLETNSIKTDDTLLDNSIHKKVVSHKFFFKEDVVNHLKMLKKYKQLPYRLFLNNLGLFLQKQRNFSSAVLLRLKTVLCIAEECLKMETVFSKFGIKVFRTLKSFDWTKVWEFAQKTRTMILNFCDTQYQNASKFQIKQIIQELKRYIVLLLVLEVVVNHPKEDWESLLHSSLQLCTFDIFDENIVMGKINFGSMEADSYLSGKFKDICRIFNSFLFHADDWQNCGFGHISCINPPTDHFVVTYMSNKKDDEPAASKNPRRNNFGRQRRR